MLSPASAESTKIAQQPNETARQLSALYVQYIGKLSTIFVADGSATYGNPSEWSVEDKLDTVESLLEIGGGRKQLSMPKLDEVQWDDLAERLREFDDENGHSTAIALPTLVPYDAAKRIAFSQLAFAGMSEWQLGKLVPGEPIEPLVICYDSSKPDMYAQTVITNGPAEHVIPGKKGWGIVENTDDRRLKHHPEYQGANGKGVNRADFIQYLIASGRAMELDGMGKKDPSRCVLTIPIVEFERNSWKSESRPASMSPLSTSDLHLVLHTVREQCSLSDELDASVEPVNEMIRIEEEGRQPHILKVGATVLRSRQLRLATWDPNLPNSAYTKGLRHLRGVISGIGER
jgi:hypothetical protein